VKTNNSASKKEKLRKKQKTNISKTAKICQKQTKYFKNKYEQNISKYSSVSPTSGSAMARSIATTSWTRPMPTALNS
jgi:hypothetical protein